MAELAITRRQLRDYALRGWAYACFFVAAFVLSAYLTFPYDHLRDFIVAKVEQSGKGNADSVRLEIVSLRPSFLTRRGADRRGAHAPHRERRRRGSRLHFDR